MEELIDVLDENGNKTGEILTREQIHKKGLCHRIVVIAIIDEKGNILMQQRSKNKSKNPGKWDVASAGHVSSGQTSTENVEEDYIDNQIYDCYIVKREQIELTDIKMQESEVEQVKLCNLKEFSEIIKNGNIMERDEFYKKIIKYLK